MSWITAFTKFRHSIFIAFIELKIEGSWIPFKTGGSNYAMNFEILKADSGEGCSVHFIEPDGLRRILQFKHNATIAIHQNILSYDPSTVNEGISVDEKEQTGKGKTRDTLS